MNTIEINTSDVLRQYHQTDAVRLLYQNRLRELRAKLADLVRRQNLTKAPGWYALQINSVIADIDQCLATASRLYGTTLSLSESGEYDPCPVTQAVQPTEEVEHYAKSW